MRSRLLVADAGDLHIGVIVGLAQQIAHVHVVEVDAHYLELAHSLSSRLTVGLVSVSRIPCLAMLAGAIPALEYGQAANVAHAFGLSIVRTGNRGEGQR